jgi:homoserine dehydrogenase
MPVDVPIALLGYGNVGGAVARLLAESADDIERATGHRLRIVRALVRDPDRERKHVPDGGVLTTDFDSIRDDPSIALVAELMGGIEPTGTYVLELLRAGKPVVSANKQLVARRGAELFAAASQSGVQLRFEASVCAAIPVIKVLRESLVATNVHRVLGIVNGTTNFILSQMELGAEYPDALAEAQRLGFAEPDPTEDVNGADAAAKMAILATVAFGSRTTLDDVEFDGIEGITQDHVRAARELEMNVRLVGSATLVDGKLDVRVQPSLVDRHHPLAGVEGPFNAVMLQGDAIREITLEGPGAGGLETASAVVADMISIVGTTGTGFLQNDACWRELERLPRGELRSPFYFRVEVADQPGVLAHIALRLSQHEVSIARLVQYQRESGATLHAVTHEARTGSVEEALAEIAALPETQSRPSALPVISSRGVTGAGWT